MIFAICLVVLSVSELQFEVFSSLSWFDIAVLLGVGCVQLCQGQMDRLMERERKIWRV
jgi:hypothetical protein